METDNWLSLYSMQVCLNCLSVNTGCEQSKSNPSWNQVLDNCTALTAWCFQIRIGLSSLSNWTIPVKFYATVISQKQSPKVICFHPSMLRRPLRGQMFVIFGFYWRFGVSLGLVDMHTRTDQQGPPITTWWPGICSRRVMWPLVSSFSEYPIAKDACECKLYIMTVCSEQCYRNSAYYFQSFSSTGWIR